VLVCRFPGAPIRTDTEAQEAMALRGSQQSPPKSMCVQSVLAREVQRRRVWLVAINTLCRELATLWASIARHCIEILGRYVRRRTEPRANWWQPL